MLRWALVVSVGIAALMMIACGSDSGGSGGGSAGGSVGGSAGSTVGGTGGNPSGGQAGVDGGLGGSGGTDGGGAAGAGGATGGAGGQPQVCSPGTKQCSGLDVQTCTADGSAWTKTSTCPYVCSAGACTGECSPGSNQCSGLSVQTCNNQGQWQTTSTCPFVCSAGACSGSCVPSTKQCNGKDAQTCDANGGWQTTQTCPILCSSGTCTGSCTPGTKQCSANKTQTCDNAGQWQDVQTCPFVCSAGSCTGSCVPGTAKCTGGTPETCNASGAWVAGSACPFVCSNGSCTGVCMPGTKQCSGTSTQTCDGAGQWGSTTACPGTPNADPTCSGPGVCGTTCKTGYQNCDGNPSNGCEADLASPTTCGSCNNTCNSTGGTPACSNGTCGIVCDTQHANCSGGVADGCETTLGTTTNCKGCGDACSAPSHAVAACTGLGCGFVCSGLWGDCNGLPGDGCEKDVSNDSKNCGGCGINCYGGSCAAGKCQYAVEKVTSSPAGISFMALDSTNAYWTTGTPTSSVYKAPKGVDAATLLASNSPNTAVGIATDGLSVFFSGTSPVEIRKVPVGGGSTTQMTGSWGPWYFATDGAHVYWTDQTSAAPCFCSAAKSTTVYRMPVGGGSVESWITVPYASRPEVAVDSISVYFVSYGPYDAGANDYLGRIYRVSKSNKNVVVLAACGPTAVSPTSCYPFRYPMYRFTLSGTHLFFIANPNDWAIALFRIPPD